MISLNLDDSMVYNGIDKTIKKYIISHTGSTLLSLEEDIPEVEALTPVDVSPSKTAEEFIKFLDEIEGD